MRPIKIELDGFMAYRHANAIDLTDVDFFSLSGPTGSGKSSLIDAMIFALYGRVPRLGAKAVAPVISSGAERARVLVEFESGDVVYTAVRSVKRTATGATTDEARLQVGDDVVASGADAVTDAVEDALSLGFDDFTRTVVLPQGDFAEFLRATPGERQGLLRKLLEFDYSDVRALSVTRAAVADDRRSEATAKLDSLEIPDTETVESAAQRQSLLTEFAEEIVEREKGLADLQTTAEGRQSEVTRISGAIDRLGSIAPPGNIDELGQLVGESRDNVETAMAGQTEVTAALAEAETALHDLPSVETLKGHKERYQKIEEAVHKLDGLDVDKKADVSERAEAALTESSAKLVDSRKEIEAIRINHSAHALRVDLSVGEQCPVCSQVVTALPESESPAGLAELETEEADLRTRVEALQGDLGRARESAAAAEAAQVELLEQKSTLEEELDGAPWMDALEETFALVEMASLLTADRREALQLASKTVAEANRRLEDSSEALASLGRQLMAARESVADLGPPLPSADDPLVQWKELLVWSQEARAQAKSDLEDAETAAGLGATAVEEARKSLESELSALAIEPSVPYAVEVTRVLENAKQELASYEKAISGAGELEKTIETAKEQAAIATALALHLKVNGFEQWLMRGALADLVEGANELLVDLSGGGYSLSSEDDGTFEIVDHRNAGETRPVSTLSGGETFLVSLALALSLAETLSGSRGAGLDAIVLDEGFGSLDEEALDTVASVLEELTGRGLMVGVISHVKELAVRAPVRYEVRRTPAGSSVELVS